MNHDGEACMVPAASVLARARATGRPPEQIMLDLLAWAAAFADPAISGFRVGAVAQGLSGALYPGANFEFLGESLGFTVHAEQAAISNAWAHGETGVDAIAVSAAPCGLCRQFMVELSTADRLRIVLPSGTVTLQSLLPQAFGPRDLGLAGGLMDGAAGDLILTEPSSDPLLAAALASANASYAPVTGARSGVALLAADGRIHQGRYAENAAFNPSFGPLPAALAALRLAGGSYADITDAVLVESFGRTGQRAASAAVLAAVSETALRYARAAPRS